MTFREEFQAFFIQFSWPSFLLFSSLVMVARLTVKGPLTSLWPSAGGAVNIVTRDKPSVSLR
jgi:hypothetical protein